ncbi:UNVERIFIED_ORG: hypothetical protein M2420_003706 [Stenotrophomonas maltophilia]
MSEVGSSSGADVSLPPNAEQLINALRQIGYSFEQAISDIVDNCVNAKSRNVLIRLEYDESLVRRVLVADDGHGMTPALLDRAMRFGAHEDSTDRSLGKFGMGMKLASFSHAQTLSVATRSAGISAGRRWTVEGVSRNWTCESISAQELSDMTASAALGGRRNGTIIEWSRIDRLRPGKNGVQALLTNLVAKLKVHLGLHFHRFIEDGRVAINIDSKFVGSDDVDRVVAVDALNPFGYEVSGSSEFPKSFEVRLPEVGKLKATAHIWPANSVIPQYRLGNRAAARQGFYFYRHDRLIQAGGWNGLVESEAEPHTSLARVCVELPASMDGHFGLNVQKSLVIVPSSFAETIERCQASDGTKFSSFRSTAEKVYRKKDARALAEYPLVPSGAIPIELARRSAGIFASGEKSRAVKIVWGDLEDVGAVFEVDQKEMCIRLDSRIRKQLLGGRRATATDLPFLKILMFLLLENDVDRARTSSARKMYLERVNEVLRIALKYEG